MTITIPDTLTLTSSLKEALLKAVTTITFNGYHQNGFNSQIDLEKLDVANALLAALSLPTHPPSPFNDASTPAPVAFRRRAIPFEKRARIVARDGFRCVECGARDGLEIDHKVPVSKGGSDDDSNLQTLCGACNRSKGARGPDA